MLTSALLVMLATSPAASLRLLEPADGDSPYHGWTSTQMRDEALRLEDLRPGFWLPATLLQVGVTALGVTLVAFVVALGQFGGINTDATIASGLGFTASLSLISIGVIQLVLGAGDRKAYTTEIETLRRLADTEELAERLIDNWERRKGKATPLPEEFIGPPPKGPPPLPLPKAPGQVSVVVPLLYVRF